MFVPGSVTDLGRTVTGVAVRALAPDISTPEAFVRRCQKPVPIQPIRRRAAPAASSSPLLDSSASPTRSTGRRVLRQSAAPRWRTRSPTAGPRSAPPSSAKCCRARAPRSSARCRANCIRPIPIPRRSRPAAPVARGAGLAARAHRSRHRERAGTRPAWSRPSGKLLILRPAARPCLITLPTGSADAMDQLKFVVLDEEDLEVVSTHLQDAVAKVADVHWRPEKSAWWWRSTASTGKARQSRQAGIPPAAHRVALRARAVLQMPRPEPGRQGRRAQPPGRSNLPRPMRHPGW